MVQNQKTNKSQKWHMRFGHLSEKGLQELVKQGLVDCDQAKLEFCKDCIYGKQHIVKFHLSKYKSKGTLEYIHSDLWGQAIALSYGGNKFFLTFIDDFSRKVWVYLLKSKDQTFEKFKEWKSLVETQTGRRIKTLRTDNGLEYLSDSFKKFCASHGIERHRAVRHTPQQN